MKLTSFEGETFLDGGTTEEQILAANIDTVFYVCSGAKNVNLSQIERFLTMVWECGANPVIVCNKIDLNDDYRSLLADIEEIALGVPVLGVSGLNKVNIEKMREMGASTSKKLPAAYEQKENDTFDE